MAHQQDGLFPQSLLKAFSVLIFIILLKDVCNGQPQLIGPSQVLVARAGDDVILPCHLEPASDVSAKTLEWTRSLLDPRFVYVSRGSQELEKLKNPSFKGRTSLFVDELKYGNISLKISKVKITDTGTYRCFIPDLEKEALVKLVVASDAATSPVISLSGIDKSRGGVVLQCESAGWYPEPELLWLDGEGNLLSAGPTETLRGPDDLYTVSSRVTVEKRHSNKITCRVQQRNTNQNRETHIHVPEDFFEIPSSSSAVIIVLAVSLALCIILLILSAVVLLRRKRTHMMNTNRKTRGHPGGGDAEVLLMTTETEKQNTSSSSTKTKKQTSYSEKESEIKKKLEEAKVAAEKLKKQLEIKNQQLENKLQDEKNRNEKEEAKLKTQIINSETDLFIQKLTPTFLTLESKLPFNKKDKINNQLKEVKVAAEKLKNQLESKTLETIKPEADELIQKLMQIFLTLDSKSEKESEIKKKLEEAKVAAEKLKKQLEIKNQQLKKELQDEKNRNEKEKAKLKTQTIKPETDESIQELMETFLTKLSGSISQHTESEKKSEITNQLKEVKVAAEKLKKQLENKNRQTINSEMDEFIKKLTQTFLTLESKLCETISRAQEEKQKMESEMKTLKNDLDSTKQQLEKKTETINQLLQEKQAAEKLKHQFKSKCHEMINSEKDEIIQRLTETCPALDKKKLQSEKITENINQQLQQLKKTTATLKDQLEKNSHETIKSEMELDEFIQKVLQTFPTLESKCETNTDISKKLQDVKQAAKHLKAELEFRSLEMIKSEKDEIVMKLMKTFPALESKWKKNTDIINQLQQVKQKAEDLKKQLEPQTHEGEEKTETIHQLQQLKQAAKILKIQLESKKQQMIKSEREKDEFIQKLIEIFPALESKWKENTEIINQLQEVKETAEKLEQLEKKNQQGKTDSEIIKQLQQDKETAKKVEQLQFQGKTDSEIIKQLQQDEETAKKVEQLQLQGKKDSKIIDQLQEVKDTAENLKKQMESKNWEMLWAEKTRNEETDRKLKELVKQLEEKKKKTEETLNELEKTSKEEDMENAPVGYKDQRRSQQTGDDEERIARGSGGFPTQHLHTTEETKGRASNDGKVGAFLPNQQQMNKPQKGYIILEEENGNYNYICLRNTSSEDKLMTGWELKLIKDRKLFTYKFQEIVTLKAGERLTLQRFNKGRSPYSDNTHVWKDMPSWNSGDKVKIILISNTKEEHQLM